MYISISKNTESIDITKFCSNLIQLTTSAHAQILLNNQPIKVNSESNIIIDDLVTFQLYFSFAKKNSAG